MTTPKLPDDLELFSMWSARLGLTPIVSESVLNILEQRGALILIPGQRSPHVSALHAMAALTDFVQRTGVGPHVAEQAKIKKHHAAQQAAVDAVIKRQLRAMK